MSLVTGLVGEHISRTRFPAALEILCEACGLTLDFTVIDTSDVSDFDFEAKVAECHAAGWAGLAATHPFKLPAAAFAGRRMAAQITHLQSCNLLTFAPGLVGYNTDYTGFLGAWRDVMGARRVGRVVVAGAGGVAGAIVPALAELGATDIAIWDRDADRAEALAAASGPVARALMETQLIGAMAGATGLANATPVGMVEYPGSAFPLDQIGSQDWVFDAVYTPNRTRFIRAAENAGLRYLTGFSLFCRMALGSFEVLTGQRPDPKLMLPKLSALKPN